MIKVFFDKIIKRIKSMFVRFLYYLNGNEILPPPLTKEEEDELIEKIDDPSGESKKILIERNLRLVVYIAGKFDNSGVNIEDLISIGSIGLIKAVNTFDPSKNIKLATYASRCIENEILMYLRRNNKTKSNISIDEPLNVDWDGNELLLSDILGTDSDIISKNIDNETDIQLLKEALGKLSERERKIMELRYGLTSLGEKTQKEVADMMGISQSYISRLEKRIITRLKKEIIKLV
ncbi:MAG: RNA polymerase sporulation sigma factor SigE [Clostridia bacterium]|jgi:RNA polymerase sporulation-specific sigma factor